MADKVRILHIMNGAVLGGMSTVVLNYYRNINRDKYWFDFLMYNSKLGPNGEALKELGCDMFFLPLKSRHPVKYINGLIKIIKQGKYDGIHVHHNETSYLALFVAKRLGLPLRIAHAHTAPNIAGLRVPTRLRLSRFITPLVATHLLACSSEAAQYVYGGSTRVRRKTVILNNAIDVDKFMFRNDIREITRSSLGLRDELVIGTVGNLDPVKNQQYLLEIFCDLKKLRSGSKLIIVGDGMLRQDLEDHAKELDIFDDVLFLGRRTDVADLLMTMDAFVMPSISEGFGIAALEAAASGLPIFLSDSITKELGFYSRHKYLSIDEKPDVWAKAINGYQLDYDRQQGAIEAAQGGYDIRENTKILEGIYSN